MITRVEFDENAVMWYGNNIVLLRVYHYEHKNPISDCLAGDIEIKIYFDGRNDKFTVSMITEEPVEFDTFRDANTYALKKIYDTRCKLDELIEQVRKYSGKRGKKNEEKS